MRNASPTFLVINSKHNDTKLSIAWIFLQTMSSIQLIEKRIKLAKKKELLKNNSNLHLVLEKHTLALGYFKCK
jgi:hypothetical protein